MKRSLLPIATSLLLTFGLVLSAQDAGMVLRTSVSVLAHFDQDAFERLDPERRIRRHLPHQVFVIVRRTVFHRPNLSDSRCRQT
jgi:hypothetical protein